MQDMLRSATQTDVGPQLGSGSLSVPPTLPRASAAASQSAPAANKTRPAFQFAWMGTLGAGRLGLGKKRILRLFIVASLDLLAIVLTLQVVVTMGYPELGGGLLHKVGFIVQFGLIATLAFWLNGLYSQSWRFMRLADCMHLIRSVAVGLAVAWLLSIAAVPMRMPGLPQLITVPLMHAALLIVLMGGMRLTRRQLQETRRSYGGAAANPAGTVSVKKAIVLGPPEWVSSVIDLVRGDPSSDLEIVGALLSDEGETIGRLAGIPVLGGWEMLASAVAVLEERDRTPSCLILCDKMAAAPGQRSRIVERAKKLDLEICQVTTRFGELLRSSDSGTIAKLSTAELLGRPEFSMESQIVDDCIRGRRVLVTGAGGTIGGELARQLARYGPSEVTLLDHAEHDLYKIDLEMRQAFPALKIRQVICSIRERDAVRSVFEKTKPEIVFHSAALKHVPLVEENPCAGVHTNVIGTRNIADAVCEFSAKAMVQISTDKAVNPVGIMGATKRVGEIYSQALDLCGVDDGEAPRFITVRFGNVLGSSGSIVPLFKKQIEKGGPLTVTHLDITRYFMTVREAVQLILQSSSHALKKDTVRGNIYVLDMGEPVRIYDLATQMIRLAGYEPEVDIGIKVVGLRPGEKLFEELFDSCEEQVDSQIPGIFEARSRPIPLPLLNQAMRRLERLVEARDDDEIRRVLHNLVRIPSGSADAQMPFGDFGSLMAEYARGNFTVVSSKSSSKPAAAKPSRPPQQNLRLVESSAPALELASRWPSYEPDEIEAVRAVLSSGRVNALMHGEQTCAFEEQFARFVGADKAIAVNNGTSALELALRSVGVGPGHEVIVPARSFFATVSCVIAVGAEPVFADIDPVSQNICPNSVARTIGPRTKAIICVHLNGWPCDVEALQALCAMHDLLLIEDCAQAHGAAVAGRRVGSFGHAAAFSFCTDKIISTAGEGGMLVTSNRDTWLRAWSYKDHGKSYEKVANGQAGGAFRYVHDSFGSNLRLTEAQAAVGRVQLTKLPGWLARRRRNAEILNDLLAGHPTIVTPNPPADITHAWYKYNLRVKLEELQGKASVEEIVDDLRARGITCGTGSCPIMSKEAAFKGREFRTDNLPIAADVGRTNLMLAIDHLFEERQIRAIGSLVRDAVV